MKVLVLLTSIVISLPLFSQLKLTGYIELRGGFSSSDEGVFISEVTIPKRLQNKIDSLINYKAIQKIIDKSSTPTQVLNFLSIEGWSLVSVIHATDTKDGKPSPYPFLLYYLKRDFIIPHKTE